MGKARAMEQLYEAKLPVAIPEIVTPVRKAVRLQPKNPWGVTVLARMSFASRSRRAAAAASRPAVRPSGSADRPTPSHRLEDSVMVRPLSRLVSNRRRG